MHAMQVVGARAAMLNKFMVEYLNESFHLSTHLSALARVFFMAAGMLALHSSPQLFAVNCSSYLLSARAVKSCVLLAKALSCYSVWLSTACESQSRGESQSQPFSALHT